MRREDLLDNLHASRHRREVVTLTLTPVPGFDSVQVGRVLAIADHYTGRCTPQVVLESERGDTIVIGISMIRNFAVGRPHRDVT
jgi:hypothetical protein